MIILVRIPFFIIFLNIETFWFHILCILGLTYEDQICLFYRSCSIYRIWMKTCFFPLVFYVFSRYRTTYV